MLIEQRFQRSRSEILMSQSPPSTMYNHAVFKDNPEQRSNTLPKDLKKENGSSSPTLSVKSLNMKPSSPRLKVKFGSSPSNMCKMDEPADADAGHIQYLVAVHRWDFYIVWHRWSKMFRCIFFIYFSFVLRGFAKFVIKLSHVVDRETIKSLLLWIKLSIILLNTFSTSLLLYWNYMFKDVLS